MTLTHMIAYKAPAKHGSRRHHRSECCAGVRVPPLEGHDLLTSVVSDMDWETLQSVDVIARYQVNQEFVLLYYSMRPMLAEIFSRGDQMYGVHQVTLRSDEKACPVPSQMSEPSNRSRLHTRGILLYAKSSWIPRTTISCDR